MYVGRDHYETHKEALCSAVSDIVSPGDNVVVVGGGRGVTATWAARQGAAVTVYEAALEMVHTLHETAQLNRVEMDIRHAVVGGEYDVYGSSDGASHVSPRDLRGDVLILDCEGAEMDILPTSVDAFERFVVETHPSFGASTADVIELVNGGDIAAPDTVDGDIVVKQW